MTEDDPIYKAIDLGGGQVCDIPGILRELDKAGYVIVPKRPTEEMVEAGDDAMDWDSSDINGSFYVHYHDGDAEKSWLAMIAAFMDKRR